MVCLCIIEFCDVGYNYFLTDTSIYSYIVCVFAGVLVTKLKIYY